ncbi:hypothetical protein PCANC_04723 [Puccinia coronata f. sp. avenae]|uniref:Uncharacterized protein n=1 Tax=Puccinia coronata f. sp. avenae TaxID=200324 RepID=A0A2N5W1N0_9BASI|nr:hypothetical protein PCANC_04723 [Puccinia coronata f. sp. avenae]
MRPRTPPPEDSEAPQQHQLAWPVIDSSNVWASFEMYGLSITDYATQKILRVVGPPAPRFRAGLTSSPLPSSAPIFVLYIPVVLTQNPHIKPIKPKQHALHRRYSWSSTCIVHFHLGGTNRLKCNATNVYKANSAYNAKSSYNTATGVSSSKLSSANDVVAASSLQNTVTGTSSNSLYSASNAYNASHLANAATGKSSNKVDSAKTVYASSNLNIPTAGVSINRVNGASSTYGYQSGTSK